MEGYSGLCVILLLFGFVEMVIKGGRCFFEGSRFWDMLWVELSFFVCMYWIFIFCRDSM